MVNMKSGVNVEIQGTMLSAISTKIRVSMLLSRLSRSAKVNLEVPAILALLASSGVGWQYYSLISVCQHPLPSYQSTTSTTRLIQIHNHY